MLFTEAEQELELKLQTQLREMKETVHTQRSEIRGLQREITSKTVDIEAVSENMRGMSAGIG